MQTGHIRTLPRLGMPVGRAAPSHAGNRFLLAFRHGQWMVRALICLAAPLPGLSQQVPAASQTTMAEFSRFEGAVAAEA